MLTWVESNIDHVSLPGTQNINRRKNIENSDWLIFLDELTL